MGFGAVWLKMATIIGGIEGGATHSTIVLINEQGEILVESNGPATNHLLLGMEECSKRIAEMVNKAKNKAGLDENIPLKALGLGLSGCETEETNNALAQDVAKRYPNLSELYAVGSDTDGSIATTSDNGGVTCIAGTGSNTLLINPDGGKVQCGGYGYMLGDEGGAWKLAHTAIKICINDIDGFEKSPHPIDWVWQTTKTHFNIKTHMELLDHAYTRFDKAFMASLCKKIAAGANEGDALARHVFHLAGRDLAKGLAAVLPKAHPTLTSREGGIHILCVGSVWLSWNLLRPGFIEHMNSIPEIRELSLMKICTTIAVGAAYMASDRLKIPIRKQYNKNYEVFFRYKSCK